MNHADRENVLPPALGVIDALSLGYRSLFSGVYWKIVVLPVALDVLFWLGPQLPWRDTILALIRNASPDVSDFFQQTQGAPLTDFVNGIPNINLLTIVSQVPGGPLLLTSALGDLPQPPHWHTLTWEISSFGRLLGMLALLMLLGAPIAGLYQGLGAQPWFTSPYRWRLHTLWTGFQLLILVLAGILLVGLAIVLSAVFLSVLYLIHPSLMALGLTLIFGLITGGAAVATVLFYFAPASMIFHRSHVGKALLRSAQVVYRNLSSTLGLFFLTLLIFHGFTYIWSEIAKTPSGVVVAIVGNAFITAGLTRGGLYFFHSRFFRMVLGTLPQVDEYIIEDFDLLVSRGLLDVGGLKQGEHGTDAE